MPQTNLGFCLLAVDALLSIHVASAAVITTKLYSFAVVLPFAGPPKANYFVSVAACDLVIGPLR